MLLTGEIGLLSHDARTGKVPVVHYLPLAFAGAGLVELLLAGRVVIDRKRIVVRDPSPGGDPVLDDLLARTVADKARRGPDWLSRYGRGLREPVMASLVASGVVGYEPSRLGITGRDRYPELQPFPRAELLDRIGAVVLGGRAPDVRTASLVGLLHAAGLRRTVLPGVPGRQTDRRMKEIAEGQWVPAAVRVAVSQVRGAAGSAAAAAGVAASS